MTRIRLPVELIHLIFRIICSCISIPELADELGRLSLACREWADIAQSLLLSVYVRHGCQYQQDRLLKTLLSSPHLVGKVNSFWENPRILSADPVAFNLTAIRNLYQELASSRNMKELILTLRDSTFPSNVHSILLSSTNLTSLSLFEVNHFPVQLLYQCTSLRHLHLVNAGFSGFNKASGTLDDSSRVDSGPPAPIQRPYLSDLYIEVVEKDPAIMAWFLNHECAFDISQLRAFHCLDIIHIETYTLAQSLIRLTSTTLEELALSPPYMFTNPTEVDSGKYNGFGHPLPNLRRLKLPLQHNFSDQASHFFWAAAFLSNLSNPERLEELDIPCIFHGDGLYRPNPDHGWDTFNAVFSPNADGSWAHFDPDIKQMPFKFPNLKIVRLGVIRLSSGLPAKHRTDRFVGVVDRLLRNISMTELLKVSVSNEPGYVDNSECWYHAPFPPEEKIVWGTVIDLTGDSD
ncbi:hypothetical protein BDN72DRAFT_963934 [Pluteus cervinus]|uniref:Uncharacterized protein n=1 Tax=Pluteus cervinus TaxID=181527 RepID=A0ACD3ACH3_9AGAR|nr:hypothetical protein BDN72DRAFT_963934 [Pluteus cervinus]